MAVPFRIVLYAADSATAQSAANAAFDRIAQLNDIMSDYDPDSELSRLSRSSGQGRWVKVSDDLWRVLRQAQALATRTDGAFDVTVGPCVRLWRTARRVKRLPDPAVLHAAMNAVGYQKLQLDPKTHAVKLRVPGMQLDLGGIAKGYAVDAAVATLRQHGIDRALVSGGGDMAMSGPPPGKLGWRVALLPLDAPNAPPPRFVLLANAAISTSGDTFQRLEINGTRFSHIVNPHTGIGLTDHSLVTVIARNGLTSDSLTKPVSVLGPAAGLKLIARTPGAAVRIVREPGDRIEVHESRRFKRFYEKLAGSALRPGPRPSPSLSPHNSLDPR
ncbi:MAG: FAD:protein FMN transferase [Verrucomicrobia bacterium]|nr:FAD:protein FMN transferase [Verrucomicrobiota bacterium]